MKISAAERFERKVDRSGGPDACHLWIAKSRSYNGYGYFYFEGHHVYAPRFAFFLEHGYWPENALHTCDTPLCCNQLHIYDGTRIQNSEDMVARGRSRRGNKHPLAILTEAQVQEIKERLKHPYSGLNVELAREFGVNYSTVSAIKIGAIWKHVK